MKGLIYKELCMFKSQMKTWAFTVAILGVYSVLLKSVFVIYMLTALIGVMSCMTALTYDKQYRCDEFLVAMPVSRKKIVVSKYLSLAILDLILSFFTIIIIGLLGPFLNESIWDAMLAVTGVFGATVFLQAVVMPIAYGLGPEKSRIVFLLIGVLPYIMMIFFIDKISISEQTMTYMLWASPVFLVLSVVISLIISAAFYKKKDF